LKGTIEFMPVTEVEFVAFEVALPPTLFVSARVGVNDELSTPSVYVMVNGPSVLFVEAARVFFQ